MTASAKARAGRLGAAARHGFPPDEAARRAEIRRRVEAALSAEPLPLPDLARRAGVSKAGASFALRALARNWGARVVRTPAGWAWKEVITST